jgi:flagellar motility protein MotE (MotC chaperone)
MSLDDAVKIFQIIAFAAAALGIGYSAKTYAANRNIKRAEWLKELFDRFYKDNDFGEIRKEIDNDDTDNTRLKAFLAVNNGNITNEDNEEKLINFLNFFEFIAVLEKKTKQLTKEKIKDLFRYYLRKIKSNVFLAGYIKKYDFENLRNLLNDY